MPAALSIFSLFIVYCLQCMHLIHQDKFLVGVKSFLAINKSVSDMNGFCPSVSPHTF